MSDRFTIPPFQNGIVREAAVDESLAPQDSVQLSINLHFDRVGAASTRPGLTLLGEQILAGSPVLGLGLYRNNAGTSYAALAMIDSTVKAYDGASWANVRTALTVGSKARFTSFVDYIIMVNGKSNQAVASWNGTGNFGTVNNVTNAPQGDFIENYRSRIWIADSATDKLYYSDVVTTSGTITWPVSPQFIQISPADGEKITGLKRTSRALLVFKNNHIYRVFSINSVDPDPSIVVGTYSQESVVEAKDGIYYHHPTGFYKFVFDGEQEEISRPIIDIIKAIPRANYANIAGWSDEDHVFWEIGDVTLEGVPYTNLVCRYTISTRVWTIYSYPQEFRSAVLYDNGTDLFQLVGDTDGNVLKVDTGTTDNGTPIFYDLVTHWMYLTEKQPLQKTLSKMGVLHENAQGSQFAYQIDAQNQHNTNNSWTPMEQGIKKDIFDVLSFNATNFTRIRFKMSGNNIGSPSIFRNFEPMDLTTSAN